MHRGSSQWRYRYWGSPCSPDLVKIAIGNNGAYAWVDSKVAEAFTLLSDVMIRHNYHVRRSDTGGYNCRKIKGTNTWSPHAWATAVDINWRTNPWSRRFVSDMPKDMVDEILNIETVEGLRVFRWGGDWDNRPETDHRYYDAMHFEIHVTPEELARGLKDIDREEDMLTFGDQGDDVQHVQRLLNEYHNGDPQKGISTDGVFGNETLGSLNLAHEKLDWLQSGVVTPGFMLLVYRQIHDRRL